MFIRGAVTFQPSLHQALRHLVQEAGRLPTVVEEEEEEEEGIVIIISISRHFTLPTHQIHPTARARTTITLTCACRLTMGISRRNTNTTHHEGGAGLIMGILRTPRLIGR